MDGIRLSGSFPAADKWPVVNQINNGTGLAKVRLRFTDAKLLEHKTWRLLSTEEKNDPGIYNPFRRNDGGQVWAALGRFALKALRQ